MFVVDNGSSKSCASLVEKQAQQAPVTDIRYIDPGDNTGPAGGTAIDMLAALERAAGDDWLMRCDEDQAPQNDRFFQDRLRVAQDCIARDPQTGAVGSNGARYDRSKARLVKPPRDPDSTYISVDCLATGYFPLYRAVAVRDVGAFRRDFFFGYTEVEYGLRMKQSGYKLYRFDARDGAKGNPRKRTVALRPVTWQQYYSLRNHPVLASEYSRRRACVRIAATALAKPALNFPRHPR